MRGRKVKEEEEARINERMRIIIRRVDKKEIERIKERGAKRSEGSAKKE